MNAKALPVLMYHHVSPAPGLVTLAPRLFEEQLAYLAKAGYHTLGAEGIQNFLAGEPIPERSVVLSFDDGYLDNYVYAYPLLKQYGFSALIFIVTDWIGTAAGTRHDQTQAYNHAACMDHIRAGAADQVMMRWSEIEETRKNNVFEFHSHTASHTRWDKLFASGFFDPEALQQQCLQALKTDLERSRETLKSRLGLEDTHLCWPQGYFNAGYQALAESIGFRYLYTTVPGTLLPTTPYRAIPRIVVKDEGAAWLSSRLRIYGSPWLARAYGVLKGQRG